ncbi:MAG: endonuclease/exonuclease/phosphatase family protein [Alphaproteobacteria bacterium]|nr:endonuclease/exonuclease/phosphatase family protein [Alphaproteobacteria bacterium]
MIRKNKTAINCSILFLTLLIFCFALSFWDNSHWLIDLTNHFRIHLFLGFLATSISLIILKHNRLAVLSILMAIVMVMASHHIMGSSSNPEQSIADQDHMSVMAFNVWKDNEELDQLIHYIKDHQPDIVGLTEVTPTLDDKLQNLRELYPYYYSKPEEGRFGLALLSKIPFEAREDSWAHRFHEPVIIVEMQALERKTAVHLLLFHPRPPINKAFAKSRDSDIKTLSHWIQEKGEAPLIILGDFNATPWSWALHALIKDQHLQGVGGLFQAGTWPSLMGYFGIPIDHILSKNWLNNSGSHVGPDLGSDHLPIHATLTFMAPKFPASATQQ